MGTGRISRVEDMPVYQLFYTLALDVEKASREYGYDFRWLRNQSLRASESVCANMTEGFYTQYSTEYLQALYRCRREARETLTHVTYAKDVRLLPAATAESLAARYEDALRQLGNLISSIERKLESRGKTKPGFQGVKEDSEEWATGMLADPDFPSTIDHQPFPIDHQPSTMGGAEGRTKECQK